MSPASHLPSIAVLVGRDSIVQKAALLETLSVDWGQTGAMHWIDCFLSEERLRWKRPILLLFAEPHTHLEDLSRETVFGAALFFEYQLFGFATGFLVTDDPFALHTILSPLHRREEVIRLTVETLLQRGAQLVACSYDSGSTASVPADLGLAMKNVKWARRLRSVPRDLELQESYDETLTQIGKSTRANLRRYRKRLLKKLSCEFIPHAAEKVHPEQLEHLNHNSLNPIDPRQFQRRWAQAANHPQGFLVGLQRSEGEWLSLVGGWRQGTTTVLNWQVNSLGYQKDSISTVMRSFLLEYEVGRGAKKIIFDGGTPTFLSHSLRKQPVFDLIVQRTSFRARLVVLARKAFGTPEFALPALYDETPEWSS